MKNAIFTSALGAILLHALQGQAPVARKPIAYFPLKIETLSTKTCIAASITARVASTDGPGKLKGVPADWAKLKSFDLVWDAKNDSKLSVVRGMVNGKRAYRIDTDNDGDVADEESRFSPNLRWIFTDGNPLHPKKLYLESNAAGQDSYRCEDLWTTTVSHNGAKVKVGAIRLLPGTPILFRDVDGDGILESNINPSQLIPVGRAAFELKIDFSKQRAVLVRSKKTPVDTGFPAPPFNGQAYPKGANYSYRGSGTAPTLLVFSSWGCAGCRKISPTIRAFHASAAGRLEIVQVVKTVKDAKEFIDKMQQTVPQIVAPEAWTKYRVLPTPTALLVNADGTIRSRSLWTPKFAESVRAILATTKGSKKK